MRKRGPWRGMEDLELTTLERVDWFNHRRRMSTLGYVPSAEQEAGWYCSTAPALVGTQHGVSMKPGPIHWAAIERSVNATADG